MPSLGPRHPGVAGTCGNTVATANAICDPAACFRNQLPTSGKLNATFFAATTSRYECFGGTTRGTLRVKSGHPSARGLCIGLATAQQRSVQPVDFYQSVAARVIKSAHNGGVVSRQQHSHNCGF